MFKKNINRIDLIIVNAQTQTLSGFCGRRVVKEWRVSTSKYGLGEAKNSFKTPRGMHAIRAKIGADYPLYTAFRSRRACGVFRVGADDPDAKDWVLTRILWLTGMEAGVNRYGDVDTYSRYIYIHGTAHEDAIGTPQSMGCVRMKNIEIQDLYDWVDVGTKVLVR